MRRLLAESTEHWHLTLCEQLPAEEGWSTLLGARVLRREPSPTVLLEGLDWEAFLAARSANFREQVRRRERRLERERGLRFRLADDASRLGADLDTLFALHQARWRAEGVDAFAGARGDFHRDFAAQALARGWLRLWFAELDGRPAAAWYGLRYGDVECYYQAGRDPALERLSIGFVVMVHSIREAIADGMREYRLLRGGERYKDRFATDDLGLETIVLGRGPIGGMAVAASVAAAALPPGARRRIAGLAG
jgi:CelD/BcsL family acetyltransferase involved in cellulose biosynthesis